MIRAGDVWYGAGACRFWTDDLSKLGRTPPRGAFAGGIPCCPNGHVGFETDAPKWWADARIFEANGNPGYVAFLESTKEQCDAPKWPAGYGR